MAGTLRDWLVLTRGSNLPTVWSNVLAGWLVGTHARVFSMPDDEGWKVPPDDPGWGALMLLLAAVSLTYAGGMILNDAFDAAWDAERRPSRPIPAGRVRRADAFAAGFAALGLGWLGTCLAAPAETRAQAALFAVALAAAVLVYDRWHKGRAFAPAVMGLCRALLPFIGMIAAGWPVALPALLPNDIGHTTLDVMLWVHAATLWALTFCITVVARHEAGPAAPPRWPEALLYLLPLPLLLVSDWPAWSAWSAAWCVAYWAWIFASSRRHPLPAGVGARVADRLASFPFLDAVVYGNLALLHVICLRKVKVIHPEMKAFLWVGLVLAVLGPVLAVMATLRLRRTIPQT
ncbi:MAG: UbiA family prenyltransferase [Opitutales bacterium]